MHYYNYYADVIFIRHGLDIDDDSHIMIYNVQRNEF